MPSCSASGRPSANWIGTKRKSPRRSRLLTKRQPREHRTHTPSNRIRPCGELMPPGLFGSTTIDCSACMEKANTRGAAGATGVVVASNPVSKMAADITDGRALGGNLRLIRSPRQRLLARANVDRMSGSRLALARVERRQEVDIPKPENLDGRDAA